MNAIRELREYLQKDRSSGSAKVLAKLAVALANDRQFLLSEIYDLPLREFELAIALMRDWRLDRYYAARFKLFDVVLNVLPEEART